MTIVPDMITCYLIYNLLVARNEIDIKHMLHILEEEALEEQQKFVILQDGEEGARCVHTKKDRYISNAIPKFNDQNNIVPNQKILGETFHNQLKI